MRLLTLLLLLCTSGFALHYNTLQLNAETIIFPKLLLLKKQPESLLIDGRIRFGIVYEAEDRAVASKLVKRLQRLYPGTIEGYPFEATMLQYRELGPGTKASALLMLHSETQMRPAAAFAKAHGIVTFAYNMASLKQGLLFGLGIERTTRVYLNREALSEYGIEFSESLYQIVRFIDGTAETGLAPK
ncbi:hypothetical protein ACXWTF_00825 [Thiomicrolovo sp. ZZH C-3]